MTHKARRRTTEEIHARLRARQHRFVLPMLLSTLVVTACGEARPSMYGPDAAAEILPDDAAAVDVVLADAAWMPTDVDPFGSGAPRLTPGHPGWQKQLCFDCHGTKAPYPHQVEPAYRPSDCVGCHGYNGAPHRNHAVLENAACASCHASVAHVPAFVAPIDCVRCHNHPDFPHGE